MEEMLNDTVEVLYQKLGSNWYAFVEIDQEIFFCAIPQHLDPRYHKISLSQILNSEAEYLDLGEGPAGEKVL